MTLCSFRFDHAENGLCYVARRWAGDLIRAECRVARSAENAPWCSGLGGSFLASAEAIGPAAYQTAPQKSYFSSCRARTTFTIMRRGLTRTDCARSLFMKPGISRVLPAMVAR